MGLFQRKPPTPLEVAEANAEKTQTALDQARIGVGKIAQQHEAAVAAAEADARAVEDAKAAAVVAISNGAALPGDDLDALEALASRKRRDELLVRGALERKRAELNPLIEANQRAQQQLHHEYIKAATDELEAAFLALVQANGKVAALTMRDDPNFVLAWANEETLSYWLSARKRWLGIAEPGDGIYLA